MQLHKKQRKSCKLSIIAYARGKGIPDTTLRGWLRLDSAL